MFGTTLTIKRKKQEGEGKAIIAEEHTAVAVIIAAPHTGSDFCGRDIYVLQRTFKPSPLLAGKS